MPITSSTCDYLVTSQQTLSSAWQAGQGDGRLALPWIAVLTFSKAVVERLGELCGLEDVPWISPHYHPYAAAHIVKRGVSQGSGVVVLVPPMGASPLACVVEDLVACGVEAIFLVCAAWSLGPPVQLGDLIVPEFTTGPDGTSIHYGNVSGCFSADPLVVEALSAAGRELGARMHVGGNGSCEALYRITARALEGFRQQGCLSMDNGEAATLFAVTRALGVVGGVVFQPYIELERGWDPSWLRDERYGAACRIQAEAVLEAAAHLSRRGVLPQFESYGGEP
jgi:uridine phosphorylase